MTLVLKNNGNRQLEFDRDRLVEYIERNTSITSQDYVEKVIKQVEAKDKISANGILNILENTAIENIDEVNTEWTYEASKIYLQRLYKQASKNRSYDSTDKYGSFYGLLKTLGDMGVYSSDILKKYSKSEIEQASQMIDPSKDLLFDFIGLHSLATRYLAKDHNGRVYELPQERWLVIAMVLMQDENPISRMHYVKEAYWALSNLYMTVATPTLKNAGLNHGQLSSCFIDTVEDSLQGIYDSNTDVAKLSKDGGGIGVYMGKVRGQGSSIKGFKNKSSGVVPWIKQLNNTAVSVDQLGTRKGAIAVYLDVWHTDIEAFLDLRLNNGDDRKRAHDIFLGACVPDYFMEQVDKRGDWYLFDPHEVKQVMGYSLEDCYDEKRGEGTWRKRYEECIQSQELTKKKVPAIDIMKRIMISQLEAGMPFMFYRDEVNRMNANSHEGIVYCSNLCTEITQNQSPTVQEKQVVEGDTIITYKKAGDFVVCNLSSVNLGHAVSDDVLERLIPIQVRMLDNVIDLNTISVPQAVITNHKYRAIGLGTFGWHHLLALKGIEWETDEAVEFADKLYEEIAYLTIKSSLDLAVERGAYPKFEGSDWSNGRYFEKRGYTSEKWNALRESIKANGIRNGYLMAVAPNASTSVIAGSTASIDPIFKPFYYEEKSDYKLPTVAPDLNHKTYSVYKESAYSIDQFWSIKQNAKRQRHIDQAISFNIYVPNSIKASVLLNLHLENWKAGGKTSYYVRSTSTDVDNCEWCQS